MVRSPDGAALGELLATRGARVVREAGETLRVTGATSDDVGQLARDHGLTLLELSTRTSSLEQHYMELTRDAVDYRTASARSSEGK
jgi:ABC-2 type transport system ATP-binding protein